MPSAATDDRCFLCGDDHSNRLQTHHIVPRRFGGSDHPENLVKLCASCHQALEKLYDDDFYERLGIQASDEPPMNFPSDGEVVDESESPDRRIPPSSPHIRYESQSRWVPIDSDKSSSDEDGPTLPKRSSLNRDEPEPTEDTDAEDSDEITSQVSTSDAASKHPPAQADNQRLHCGYCPTVFEPHQHARAARHLRIHHFIEDPYEISDSAKKLFR